MTEPDIARDNLANITGLVDDLELLFERVQRYIDSGTLNVLPESFAKVKVMMSEPLLGILNRDYLRNREAAGSWPYPETLQPPKSVSYDAVTVAANKHETKCGLRVITNPATLPQKKAAETHAQRVAFKSGDAVQFREFGHER